MNDMALLAEPAIKCFLKLVLYTVCLLVRVLLVSAALGPLSILSLSLVVASS